MQIRKCGLSPTIKNNAKGLILSFWPEWEEQLAENRIKVVFRKNAAVIPVPAYLYAYLNKPMQRIVGRSPLLNITKGDVTQCLEMSSASGYSEEDIQNYVRDRAVFVYHLGDFAPAPKPIALKELAAKYGFVPSPQAILLSDEGILELNKQLGF